MNNTANQQPDASCRRRQFSLGGMFTVVLFVGTACAVAKYISSHVRWSELSLNPVAVAAVCSVSTMIFGAIGLWRQRLMFWLSYGFAFAVLVELLILLSRATA